MIAILFRHKFVSVPSDDTHAIITILYIMYDSKVLRLKVLVMEAETVISASQQHVKA